MAGPLSEQTVPKKILTIAIPTYNRSQCLDLCLAQICKQLPGNESELEVIVSDNASPDETAAVVQKYLAAGFDLKYTRNKENIGTRNIEQCFRLAQGKYVVVFADDDVFLDGSLSALLAFLEKADYGIVNVTCYSFGDDFKCRMKKQPHYRCQEYASTKSFVRRINYLLTFISGNIVNKSLVNPADILPFTPGGNVNQLSWVFSALFKAKKNAVIEGYPIAAKEGNTGGYPLCRVFGVNANEIFDHFIAQGIDQGYFRIINNRLLINFFPGWIYHIRKNPTSFVAEDFYGTLYPLYKGYPLFWLYTYPITVLPLVGLLRLIVRGTR
jgi:glycosyltransferase involved in cell wall biosynthesis